MTFLPDPRASAIAARDSFLDLDTELDAALAAVRPQHVARLAALGVSGFMTCAALRLVGVARVLIEGEHYQPHDAGEPAVIVAVHADGGDGLEFEHAAPLAAALVGGDVVDLIAFVPSRPERFALRGGAAVMLGLMSPQILRPDPTTFRRTPLDWLRAEGEGVCLLDHRPHVVAGILARTRGGIFAADLAHARELRAIAERPHAAPPIFVAEAERNAA